MIERDDEIAALRARLVADPADAVVRLALVRALMNLGRMGEAQSIFGQFDVDSGATGAPSASATSGGPSPFEDARTRRAERLTMVPILTDHHPSRAHGADLQDERVDSVVTNDGTTPIRHLTVVRDPDHATEPAIDISTSGLKLYDIVGLATVRRNLEGLLAEVREPDQGNAWLGGMMLYGPADCGKHFCARVIAGELGAELWTVNLAAAVPVHEIIDALKPVLADTAKRVVLFLDNLDAVPGHVDQHAGALLSALVPLLDGARQVSKPVIFGACTYPWAVSSLIVRPGRLGEVLLVLPPDGPARAQFLMQKLADVPSAMDEIEWVADHTDGFSFRDLENLLFHARRIAGEGSGLPLRDITHAALRKARQTASPTSAEWLDAAGHHALMSEAGGLYDDLLAYFRARERPRNQPF